MITKNERKILKLIKYAPVLLVICLSIVATYLFFLDKNYHHKQVIQNKEKSFILENKHQIQNEVTRVYDYILYEKKNSEYNLKKYITQRVDEAYNIMTFIYEKYKSRETKEEITLRIKDALRKNRFNNNRGYFYIYTLKGISVLHSLNHELEGKNLSDFTDYAGVKVIKKTIESLKESNSSFNEVYWNKPNDLKNQYKKITYNRVFEPYNWFLGSGEYIDDFEKELKEKVLSYINTIKYSKNGYVFVVKYDGVYLSHIKKAYIGLNRISLKDKNGVLITQEIIETAKKGEGFIKYIGTIKPDTKLPASKTTFIKGFPDWNWAIATGFYTDELEAQVKIFNKETKEEKNEQLFNLLVASLVVTLLFLWLSLYISKIIEFRFLKYRKEVRKQITRNRQKDSMLAQQSKMAAMGEMIQNIAHQWRQPLNTITTIASGVKFKKEFNMLEDKDIYESMDHINTSSKYLSQTIEDFREFFNPNKKIVCFMLKDTFEKTFNLLESQFNQKGIRIIRDLDSFNIYGYENELIQVMINLLNNSRDEFEKKEQLNKIIIINAKIIKEKVIIHLKDNAGGINEEILDRVFEPYFTTKHKSQGTGIGLYMSREIIVKHMKGEISVRNENFNYEGIDYIGASFEIILSSKKIS